MTAENAIDYDTEARTAPPPAPTATAPGVPAATSSPPLPKNPWLAGFFSLFPGLGHIYNGLYLRGVTFFLIVAGLIAIAAGGNVSGDAEGLFGFGVAFFWAFNVLDAFRQASLINLGYASDLGIADRPPRAVAGQGMAAAGAVLFLIGLVAFLDRFVFIDLRWIVDLWPFGFMGLGGWLVVKAFLAKRGRDARESRFEEV